MPLAALFLVVVVPPGFGVVLVLAPVEVPEVLVDVVEVLEVLVPICDFVVVVNDLGAVLACAPRYGLPSQ
jgi:hypothetical protein